MEEFIKSIDQRSIGIQRGIVTCTIERLKFGSQYLRTTIKRKGLYLNLACEKIVSSEDALQSYHRSSAALRKSSTVSQSLTITINNVH
uniref:Uncharacterized protein n=1 Tax=Romanomermis culicivorax TaxID=13658 RepID=A0A915KSQ4_ROMCU